MKSNKIMYWSTTGLLSGLLLMSAGMYIFNHEMIEQAFHSLSYPTYIIYPLAIAKILAVVVLLIPKKMRIKEWMYTALLFNFILAFFAHIMINDGEQMAALIAIVLLIVSYVFYNKVFKPVI